MPLTTKLLLNTSIPRTIKKFRLDDGYLLATRDKNDEDVIYNPELVLEANNENMLAVYSMVTKMDNDIEKYKKALALNCLYVIPYSKIKKKAAANEILSAIKRNMLRTQGKIDKFLILSDTNLYLYEYSYFDHLGKHLLIRVDEKSGLDLNGRSLDLNDRPSNEAYDFGEFHTSINHPQLKEKTLDELKEALKNKTKRKKLLKGTFFLLEQSAAFEIK